MSEAPRLPRGSILDDPAAIRSRQAEIAIEERRGCERCGGTGDITRGPRGCSYHYEGQEGDANDPNYANLCPPCWVEEREYWNEMWTEYYGMVR